MELHTLLFDDDSPLRDGTTFSPANVVKHSIDSCYHGRPIKRLSPELQLAYMASSWVNDLWSHNVHPSFIATLLDATYLFGYAESVLRWSEAPSLARQRHRQGRRGHDGDVSAALRDRATSSGRAGAVGIVVARLDRPDSSCASCTPRSSAISSEPGRGAH